MTRTFALAAAIATTLALPACGSDDEPAPSAGTETYETVSDVTAHAAVGKDAAEIRTLLAPAEDGAKADFAAASRIWAEGANSEKDDGTMRTLAGFVEESPIGDRVEDALAGEGEAAELDPAERREWVDKGITAAMAEKVLGELEAAAEKAAAGETDPEEGAPHNVDEAWAFFTAEDEGPVTTAGKRAADYGLEDDELSDPVLDGLAEAQTAAEDGDADALEAASEEVRGGLNRIFALAVKKYAVEGADDEVARQEGLAFSWGLGDELPSELQAAVDAAFGGQASPKATKRLNQAIDGAREELGIDGALPDYPG